MSNAAARRHTVVSGPERIGNHTTIHFSANASKKEPVEAKRAETSVKYEPTKCVEDCGKAATVDCATCSSSFCDVCFARVHEKSVALSRHISVPVGYSQFMKRCTKHPDQLEDFFCINCNKKICVKCTFTSEHRGHDATFLEEYANTIDKKEQLARIEGTFKKIEEHKNRIESIKSDRSRYEQDSVKKISESWDKIIRAAQKCKKEMLDKIRANQFEKAKTITEREKVLTEMLNNVGSYQNFMQANQSYPPAMLVDVKIANDNVTFTLNSSEFANRIQIYERFDLEFETLLDSLRKACLKPLENKESHFFDELGLKPEVVKSIPFDVPTRAQIEALQVISTSPLDILIQKCKNSGTTVALCIGSIQLLENSTTVLILSPNDQSIENIKSIIAELRYRMNLRVDENQILVGTPETINVKFQKHLKNVKHVLIDDGDTFSNIKPIQDVLKRVMQDSRIIAVSSFESSVAKLLYSPTKVDVTEQIEKKQKLKLDLEIQHFYVIVQDEDIKLDLLEENYDNFSQALCVAYCASRKQMERVSKFMEEKEHPVLSIPGPIDATLKQQIDQFKTGIIVTTDLLSTQFTHVNIVVNVDIPKEKDNYVRRVACERRDSGTVINFVSQGQITFLRAHEHALGFSLQEILPGYGVSVE